MEQDNILLDSKGDPLTSKQTEDPKSEESINEAESQDKQDKFETSQEATSIGFKQKIKNFLKFERGKPKNLKAILIIALIVTILVIGGATAAKRYWGYEPPTKTIVSPIKDNQKEQSKPILETSALDGTMVDPSLANRHPLAIMIENHPDARPQSGLDSASLVYEIATEGGITRFLAVYGPKDAEVVGPIRSARTYFVDWALEYNAFYAHAGGSFNGLAKIVSEKVLDLPHANYPNKAYWRQPRPGIASEHTLFADTKKLREIAEGKKWSREGDFIKWQFKEDVAEKERPTSGKITINFSVPSYKVVYDYDSKTNSYGRTLAGLAHKDVSNNNQLKPKNIVVQKVTRREVESGGKTVGEITDVGSGEAIIFLDGQMIKGSWSKKAEKRRTLFYNEEGAEVKFNPGQTFIEVIDPSSSVDWQIGEISKETSAACTKDKPTDCEED